MLNLKKNQKQTTSRSLSTSSLVIMIFSAAVAASLIFYARPISEYLVGKLGLNPKPKETQTVGQIEAATENTYIRRHGELSFSKLNKSDLSLRHKDFIRTEKGGPLRIKFHSGDIIELNEQSQAYLEEWKPSNAPTSKIYLTLLRGSYSLVEKGPSNRFLIVRERKVFAPGDDLTAPQREFTIRPSTEQISISGNNLELPDTAPEPKTPSVETNIPDKLIVNGSETLSNQYIEGVLAAKAPLFRRCQIVGLRDGQSVSGDLLVSLTIQPSGQVDDVKVLQKSISNKQLESCVLSVLERTQFRSYDGSSFSLSYPLTFR